MARNDKSPPHATDPRGKPPAPITSPGSRNPTTTSQAAGLDHDRHAAAQRAAHEAEILRKAVVPAALATAIRINEISASGYRAYLDSLLLDAGNPTDPIEIMMLEQLVMAHFRIAQLHGSAGQAQGIEAVKMLSSAAARLLGEFRRTVLAIRVYRDGVPGDGVEKPPRLHKLAQ